MSGDVEDPLFRLASYVRHRPWCPEFSGPGDCTCGLYALLDSIRCTCGHKVSIHTDRDVDDVVGWPCNECKSKRCLGFRAAIAQEGSPVGLDEPFVAKRDGDPATCEHGTILAYRFDDATRPYFGEVALWACDACGRRFAPRAALGVPDGD